MRKYFFVVVGIILMLLVLPGWQQSKGNDGDELTLPETPAEKAGNASALLYLLSKGCGFPPDLLEAEKVASRRILEESVKERHASYRAMPWKFSREYERAWQRLVDRASRTGYPSPEDPEYCEIHERGVRNLLSH